MRAFGGRLGSALVALVSAVLVLVATPVRVAAATGGEGEKFPQVGTLRLLSPRVGGQERTGWLILNPVSRRGYQIFEDAVPSAGDPHTWVQSFDLDTLKPLRRVVFAGVPVMAADATGVNTTSSGDPLHAVDPEGHRIYLALGIADHRR